MVFSGLKDSDAPTFRRHRLVGTCWTDAFLIRQASVSAKRSLITADRACRSSQLGPFWANRDGGCGDHHVAGPYQQHMPRFGSHRMPNDQANAGTSNGPPEVMLRPVGVEQFGDFDATPRISEWMHELKLLIPLNFDSVATTSTACVSLGVYRLFLEFLTEISVL